MRRERKDNNNICLIIFICFVALNFANVCAQTTVYYLDASAPGGGSGSAGNPFNNLNDAFVAMNANLTFPNSHMTLYIAAGAYSTNTVLKVDYASPLANSLTIIGQSSETVLGCGINIGDVAFISVIQSASGGQRSNFSMSNIILDGSGCGSNLPALSFTKLISVELSSVTIKGFISSTTAAILSFNRVTKSITSGLTMNQNTGQNYVIAYNSQESPSHDHQLKDSRISDNGAADDSLMFVGDDLTLDNVEIDLNNVPIGLNIQNTNVKTQKVSLKNTFIHDNTLSGDILNFGSSQPSIINIDGESEISENQNTGNIMIVQPGNIDQAKIDINAFIAQNQNDAIATCTSGSIRDTKNNDLCGIICPTNQKFDRCYVCGGSSSCVGCDNIPYSNATCAVPSTSDADNNTETEDSVAEWPDGSPDLILRAQSGSPHFVQLNYGKLEERTPAGTVVAQLELSTLKYFITHPPQADTSKFVKNFAYYTTDAKFTKLNIEQILFRARANVTSGGVSFEVDKNKLKYTIDIDNWPYASSANYLVLGLKYTLSESLQNEQTSINTLSSFNVTTIDITTPQTQVNLNLQNFAVIDSVTTPIKITQTGSTPSSRSFEIKMPPNFVSCSYDPDFGVVVTTDNSNGGDGSTDSGLIIGLAVGLGGFALLVVVVVILIAVVLTWLKIHQNKKHARLRTEMVNFDNGEQDEENIGGSSSSED